MDKAIFCAETYLVFLSHNYVLHILKERETACVCVRVCVKERDSDEAKLYSFSCHFFDISHNDKHRRR